MEPPKIFSKPLKPESWYKQYTRIIEEMTRRERPIDKLTIAEIGKMYEERNFLCDSCGKKIEDKNICTLKEHILHLIDPFYEWCCEECFQQDLREGRIIAMEDELLPTD
jgi:hypothetical protein